MSESISDLLSGRRFNEPPEIKIIQEFVQSRYKVTPVVSIAGEQIVIGVRSAALAGTLRPLLPQIKAVCDTSKRLVIRISN